MQNLTDHSKQAVNARSALTPTATDISMPRIRHAKASFEGLFVSIEERGNAT
jgi:hypothetical protein